MAKEKKTGKKDTASGKKKILKTVTEQLTTSLTNLKGQLGEKKFKRRVKKAAKKLVAGIKQGPVKKAATKTKKTTLLKTKPVKPALKKAE